MKVSSFILMLSSNCFESVKSDNPTGVVAPYSGEDPGYILAESNGGLSNRLRVMAAYIYIGEVKFGGAHLAFVWDINDACPGHFLQIFDPIPNVMFATNSSRYVLDKNAKIVFENSFAVFNWIMEMNSIPKNKYGFPKWTTIEYNIYSRYSASRDVMKKVTEFVTAHNICNASAMHVRVTDLSVALAKTRKKINMASYFAFVESRPPDEPVFLLTDNPDTQRLFLDKYGPKKIIFYSLIAGVEQQRPIGLRNTLDSSLTGNYTLNDSDTSEFSGNSSGSNIMGWNRNKMSNDKIGAGHGRNKSEISHSKHLDATGSKRERGMKLIHALSEDHRFTSIEHTLIDVLIAAHSKTFKPAMYSSLSDLIHLFSRIGKQDRGWCS